MGGEDTESASQPYGPNNETLPERLQDALRRLVLQFSTESELSRRQEIRRIKQAHQFWRGLQYLWWDERDQNWHLPFEQKLTSASSLEDMPRYEFVTNIYQAFGLSLIAVLSQDVPRVRFFPSSAQAEEDVAAAKAATEVAGLVERNNRDRKSDCRMKRSTCGRMAKLALTCGSWWTGRDLDFILRRKLACREVRVGGDCYVCPECGAETAPGRPGKCGESGKQRTKASAVRQEGPGACARVHLQCGALLTEEDFVAAEMITVPAAQTRLRVPNGQEVITIVGGLELKTPPWANEMHEYPYLQWNMEVHQARLRAAYPHAADKIGAPVAPECRNTSDWRGWRSRRAVR